MVFRQDSLANRIVHVRFQGKSWDIPFSMLDIGDRSSDRDVREALARHLGVPARMFDRYVIERHDTGNITVRPEAVFGQGTDL